VSTIPEVHGLPFIGVGHRMFRDPMRFFERLVDELGRVQKVKVGGQDIVFLHDAELIEQMLLHHKDAYNMSRRNQQTLDPLLGNSIPVTTDVLHWEHLHTLMLPMFTPRMMVKYFDATRDAVTHEVRALDALARRGEDVNLYEFVRIGVFHALTKTLFKDGVTEDEIPTLLDHFTNQNHYMTARYLIGDSPLINLWPAARRGKRSLEVINRRIGQLIAARRAEQRTEAHDMLDVLIQARDKEGLPLSDKVIRDNTMALFFGGQETTPGSITWAFGLLAANPEKRDLMLAEIDEVLQGRDPEFADLNRLKYTEMVLDEAMRLYPMFPFIEREAVQDTQLGEYAIPRGTTLGFVGWTTHRDPANWPSPESFIPERHAAENKKGRPRCALISFGYGTRRCLGERVGRMESMLMLVMISQRFLLNHSDNKLPDYIVRMSPKPRNGMPMVIVPRRDGPR
jgi:cytochrome P450